MTREQQVLRERARALAVGSAETLEQPDRLEVLRFDLASEKYAVELAWIGEVRPLTGFTVMPCVPRYVRGIINVRGRIVSIIDLKFFFDLPETGLTGSSKLIILRSPEMELGLLVDEVLGIAGIPAASLQTSLPTLSQVRAEYLKGVTPDGVVVLDSAKILAAGSIVVNNGGAQA